MKRIFLAWLMPLFLVIISFQHLISQTVILPIEILGQEGKTESVIIQVSQEQVNLAQELWLQVNNLGYQDKGSVQVNDGNWLSLNHTTVKMQQQEKARGGMVHGGFNTIRFSVPITDMLVGDNTLRFRFDRSDGISNGFRIIKLNLLDAKGDRLLPESMFEEVDPKTWQGPYSDVVNIEKGRALWYNAELWNHNLPDGRKASWYGQEMKESSKIRANCASCHTQDGRDLEIFSYSNESIIARAQFHKLTEEEGKQIASYIRTLSGTKDNVGRYGRPWNPPYQPGPELANVPIEQWAAGAGLEAVLESDKDMAPYMFPDGITQETVYDRFDSEKMVDRTTMPLSIQFPDWKHWLPIIHPVDAYSNGDYYNRTDLEYSPKRGIEEFSSYLNAMPPAQRDKDALMDRLADFWWEFRGFLAQGGDWAHWRTKNGDATILGLAEGAPRELAATSLAKLIAVKHFEFMNEFDLQDKAAWFAKPEDQPADRQWFGTKYSVFEVPPHFQACVDNDCNSFEGQSNATGFFESTAWYQLQLVVNGGNGMVAGNSPVDYNYHPDFGTKSSRSSGIYEPLRYYHSMNAMYQTRTWSEGDNPNNGKGFRIRVMGPWNIYGVSDGNQFNGFEAGEFAKLLDEVEPGMTAWVMNAMLKQFLNEVQKDHNRLEIWERAENGDDNKLDRRDKTYADLTDHLNKLENKIGEFGHYAAKFYYYIPKFQELGVDCQIIDEVINWCSAAWPNIDWSVFRNTGKLQLELLQLDQNFCNNDGGIRAITKNKPSTTTGFIWEVNGETVAVDEHILPGSFYRPGDVVSCSISSDSQCIDNRTVRKTLDIPIQGVDLLMRKNNETSWKSLQNSLVCEEDTIELQLQLNVQPKMWLDAMDVYEGEEPENNSYVERWNDISGNGFTAEANKTDLRPKYMAEAFNGLPAIVFGDDGNADGLELFDVQEDDFMDGDWTIFLVGQTEKPDSNGDWRDLIGNKTEGSNGWFYRFGSDARAQLGIGSDLKNGKNYDFERSFIIQVTKRNEEITAYINGRIDLIITKPETTELLIDSGLYLGQASNGNASTSRYHKGPISELIVFDYAVIDAQRKYIEGYLTHKWNMNEELPYTHTYAKESPFKITVATPSGDDIVLSDMYSTTSLSFETAEKLGMYAVSKNGCEELEDSFSFTNEQIIESATDLISYRLNDSPQVTANNVNVQLGDYLILSPNYGFDGDFQWQTPVGDVIPINTNPEFIVQEGVNNGIWKLTVLQHGCMKADLSFDFLVSTNLSVKINEEEITDVLISPNPVEENFTLYLPDEQPRLVKLWDLNGKALDERLISGITAVFDMGSYAAGVYVLSVNSSGGEQVMRVIKIE